ncbi:MAG: hypothetical protein WD397_09240 [Wenzhouxiangellaceae bacterium]
MAIFHKLYVRIYCLIGAGNSSRAGMTVCGDRIAGERVRHFSGNVFEFRIILITGGLYCTCYALALLERQARTET